MDEQKSSPTYVPPRTSVSPAVVSSIQALERLPSNDHENDRYHPRFIEICTQLVTPLQPVCQKCKPLLLPRVDLVFSGILIYLCSPIQPGIMKISR